MGEKRAIPALRVATVRQGRLLEAPSLNRAGDVPRDTLGRPRGRGPRALSDFRAASGCQFSSDISIFGQGGPLAEMAGRPQKSLLNSGA